jgi:hypothetical protein
MVGQRCVSCPCDIEDLMGKEKEIVDEDRPRFSITFLDVTYLSVQSSCQHAVQDHTSR